MSSLIPKRRYGAVFELKLKPNDHVFYVKHNDKESIVDGGSTVRVRLGDVVRDLTLMFPNLSNSEIKKLEISRLNRLYPKANEYKIYGNQN